MPVLSNGVLLPENCLEWTAIRAQGSGGQNVNKVSSAIHLRFNIHLSNLSENAKQKLLERADKRLSAEGVFVIKAQKYRTQEQNRTDALERLTEIIDIALMVDAPRIETKPTYSSRQRRLKSKSLRSDIKSARRPPSSDS